MKLVTRFFFLLCASFSCLAAFTPSNFISLEGSPLPVSAPVTRWVESAAQFAISELNSQKQSRNEELLRVHEIMAAQSQVKQGTIFSFVLEFDRGLQYSFEMVQPADEPIDTWLSLPANGNETVTDLLNAQRMPEISLQGPMFVQFAEARDDVALRLPHWVDAGTPIRRVKLDSTVHVQASGITHVRLVEPVEVQLLPTSATSTSDSSATQVLQWKQMPRVEIAGKSISFVSQDRTKVKRKGGYEVEFVNATSTSSAAGHTQLPSVTLSPNNPLLLALQQVWSSGATTKAIADIPQNLKLRRVVAASAAAVTAVWVPMELEDNGAKAQWEVVVVQDANGNRRVVSTHQAQPINAVTVQDSVIQNGTLPELLESYQLKQPIFLL